MNQSVVSGIGNVYRAELLFRAKINPHTLGQDLSVSQLTAIWLDAVKLMKIGVLKGVMVTRQEQLNQRSISSERNYVYKREGLKCFRCKGTVVIEVMASRKLYWCPGCQN